MKKTIFFIIILAKTATATELTLKSSLSIRNVRIANKQVTHLVDRKFDRQLFIMEDGYVKNVFGYISKEYYTDDSLREIHNQKNKIAAINITTYGVVSQPNDKQSYHEVTSCAFINIATGCIISRESAITCSGKWIGNESWETDQGEKIDMAALKNSILSKTTGDTDLIKNENYSRCKKSQLDLENIK